MASKAQHQQQIETFEREKDRELYNLKLDFFTNIAHEIKTPLTLIKLPLDKLLEENGVYATDALANLTIMKKNTNRLIELTQQLLNFRKIESDKFKLTFAKCDVSSLLNEVYYDFKDVASQHNLSYQIQMPRIPLTAIVDEEALKKMVTNLISNATKYGHSNVNVRLLPFNSDDTHFNIEIENDGAIIPESHREKIFEPFYRIQGNEKIPGTGIGLALVRSLAELHNGSLTYVVTSDATNLFLLSLPIFQENEEVIDRTQENIAEEVEVASQHDNQICLLVVEDNREILDFLRKDLGKHFQVVTATNGLEAMNKLENHTIHLIVSDIMMPIMDGIEMCRQVKSQVAYNHIPIILLTAKNSVQSKIEGLETGADAYIEKPFNFAYLLAQIHSLLNNRALVKEYFTKSPLTHLKSTGIAQQDKMFIQSLTDVIAAHIDEMDLNVDQLSKLMNLSRPSLYRKIKSLSDLTPNELIQLVRLRKAVELLAQGNHRINEVAVKVGYSIQSNFSRDFSKQFGMTPSQFIDSLKPSK